MYLADYHTHSAYSFDGCETLDAMCQQAIKTGLSEIAITDHMDIFSNLPYGQMINFDEPGGRLVTMDVDGLYRELAQIQQSYEGRLKVKIGAELGQPQVNLPAAEAFLETYDLDFVIGSVHNMENDRDVYYYDFTGRDLYALYDHYLDWLLELAEKGDFDVMGHLTYPVRYMFERQQMRISLERYTDKFRRLFAILISKGKGIELNVSGLSKAMNETMPPLAVLKLYRECGGEIVTIGSDAHQAAYIGSCQKEAHALLREAGFSKYTVFTKRKPEFIQLM